MGRIPGEGLGRRHGARLHGNRERHIDRTAARIGEAAVRALHEEGAAAGHIDGAVVRDIAARRNTEGLAIRIDHDTRRDVLRHNRVVGQRNRRVAVLARPCDCVVDVAEVVPLAAHFHIGDIAGDERNRLIDRCAALLIGTELNEETVNIIRCIIISGQVVKIVPLAVDRMHLHDRLITVDACAAGAVCRVRFSRCEVCIHSVQRSDLLLVVLNACLGTVLPTEILIQCRRSGRMTDIALCVVRLPRCAKRCAVVRPSGNAVRIVQRCPAVTACPCADRRDVVKYTILGCGSNRDQVAHHAVQTIGLCEVVAVRPADQLTRIRLHIHIVVLCRIALVRARIRNRSLGNGCAGRQVIRTVSERNLDLLRSPCARQMELNVILNKSLRIRRCQRRRENNLVELVRSENVRKGLNTGRRAEELNAARIDLEVHRGDAGSRGVGDRHIL